MMWLVRYKNKAGEYLAFTVNATDQCEAYDIADRMFKGTDPSVTAGYELELVCEIPEYVNDIH